MNIYEYWFHSEILWKLTSTGFLFVFQDVTSGVAFTLTSSWRSSNFFSSRSDGWSPRVFQICQICAHQITTKKTRRHIKAFQASMIYITIIVFLSLLMPVKVHFCLHLLLIEFAHDLQANKTTTFVFYLQRQTKDRFRGLFPMERLNKYRRSGAL